MDDRRRGHFRPVPRRPVLALAAFLGILFEVIANQPAVADDGSILLTSAAQQGTFNVGAANAAVTRATDPEAGDDILKLNYMIPPGTTAGIYAKAFPADLSAKPDRRRAAGDQGGRAQSSPPAYRGDRDQGRGGPAANPPGHSV